MSKLPVLRPDDPGARSAWRDLGTLVAGAASYPQSASAPFADVPRRVSATRADGAGDRAHNNDDVLVRLFSRQATIAAKAAAAALAPVDLDALVRAGFMRVDGPRVNAAFQIQRWGDVLVACDWPEHGDAAEYVHGVTNAGRTLAYLTPRRPVDRALDLGTGCGLQAVLAARHARQVVATDVNARAVALATVSACLNDAGNIEARTGSWFEPVADDAFDLVVANPPYVISPERHLVYRDGGPGDELCGWLLSAMPAVLRDSGLAVVLVNWARRVGEAWADTPARWLGDVDAYSIAIKFAALPPRDYARRFNAPLADSPKRLAAAVESWLAYYEQLRIEELVLGAVAMTPRATADPTPDRWWPFVAAQETSGPGGAQLARMLENSVRAAELTTDAARRAVPTLAPGHELWQRLRFVDGVHVADDIHVVLPDGLGVEAEIAPSVLPLVLAVNGEDDIETIVRDLHDADALPAEVTPDAATQIVLDLARAGFVDID